MKSRSALQFVVIIGIANFFADFTYEGARGIVGPFLGSLGASAAIVGFVAGLGELMGCVRSRDISPTNRIGIGGSHLRAMPSTCSPFPRSRWPDAGRWQRVWSWQNASGDASASRLWKPCFRTPANRSVPDGFLD